MAVTGQDIARALGMSQSTVSRALRGDARVTQATRDRVTSAARQLGYVPDILARSLITKRTDTIAVYLADLGNPAVAELSSIVHDELHSLGYRAALFSDRYMSSGPALDHLRGGATDGVVFASGVQDTPLVSELLARNVPLVLLNRDVAGVTADRVLSDNYRGGVLAAEHLLELGHRRFGLLRGDLQTLSVRARIAGFLDTLAAAGIALDERFIAEAAYSHEESRRVAALLLSRSPRPTAVFCTVDVGAFGVLAAALDAGLAVPRQLSVVGFDDLDMCSWSTIALSTIHNPFREMARRACQMLIERIQTGKPIDARREIFDVHLVARRTSGPAPLQTPTGRAR